MHTITYQPDDGPEQTLFVESDIAPLVAAKGNPNMVVPIYGRLTLEGETGMWAVRGSRITSIDKVDGYKRHRVIYAADVVLFSRNEDVLHVLLIRRSDDSDAFPGAWALPGGCVEPDETAQHAACREAGEETDVHVSSLMLDLVGHYDEPGRDPRGRVVSIAYRAMLDGLPTATAGDDAVEVRWMPYDEAVVSPLAFDHTTILFDAYHSATR